MGLFCTLGSAISLVKLYLTGIGVIFIEVIVVRDGGNGVNVGVGLIRWSV